ncbi:RHS repeat-associated core domain-containing protein, partial [Pasteurellaceae bacterium LIM206]|nr:RHS repeat-associated core domain-containing protein [Pasteurellaceae bacterium LIM206]
GYIDYRQKLNLWGEAEIDGHRHYAANDENPLSCNHRFVGQYYDEESGLHYNRFRYYSPETGQYISSDPIGLLGGFNPYGYVGIPTGWVDPLGLKGCTVVEDGGNSGDNHDITLKLDKNEYQEAFGHIDDYINGNITGKNPDGNNIFEINRGGAGQNRSDSLDGIPTKPGYDRDEFPMAMFKEGGKGASVRYITPSDNRGAGSSISRALSSYDDGTRVRIIVE